MTENEVATQIVDVAFKIHTNYGPGLLESVYETILAYEEWNYSSRESTRGMMLTLRRKNAKQTAK